MRALDERNRQLLQRLQAEEDRATENETLADRMQVTEKIKNETKASSDDDEDLIVEKKITNTKNLAKRKAPMNPFDWKKNQF